jgi:hypothetical protein
MLLREDRGRHEHRDLLVVHHGLERGADRDLGLAVAHVAADQRSIGRGASMSAFTSSIARSWCGVSS